MTPPDFWDLPVVWRVVLVAGAIVTVPTLALVAQWVADYYRNDCPIDDVQHW